MEREKRKGEKIKNTEEYRMEKRFREKVGEIRLREKEIEKEWKLLDKEEAGKGGIKGV